MVVWPGRDDLAPGLELGVLEEGAVGVLKLVKRVRPCKVVSV